MAKFGGLMRLRLLMTLALVGLFGCGEAAVEQESPTPGGDVDCVMDTVPAREVEVSGDLSTDERAMVEWALSRFEEADLELPPMIEVGFDPTRVACRGSVGFCEPGADLPSIYICDDAGESAFRMMNREMTLLHELAHLWYAAAQPQPDIVAIVRGEDNGTAQAAWADRSVERMAIVMTWGLMDQSRRPVALATPCVELYQQFFELTGHLPLDPLEGVCIPDNIPKLGRDGSQ